MPQRIPPRPASEPPRPTSGPPRPTSGPPRPTSGPPRPTSAPPARRRRRFRYAAAAIGVAIAIVVPIVIVNSLSSSPASTAAGGKPVVPVADECFATAWANAIDADLNTVYSVDDRVAPVTCTQRHAYEVVSVRGPSPSERAAAAPPSVTSDAMPALYHDCVNDAFEYLGGDWRSAYAWLGIAVPSVDAWQRGAHWTACLLRPTATWQGVPTQSATSLRNGLRGDRLAAVGCIDIRSNPIECDRPHAYEAVGVYRAPVGPFPGTTAGGREFKAGCEAKVATYLGLSSVSNYHNPSVGWSWWPSEPDAEQWNIGDRYALCAAYAVRSGHAMSGSVRDLGNKAPQP
ncbi:MAG TPA: septum formation family protein [Micromonosporaceae bacterium]